MPRGRPRSSGDPSPPPGVDHPSHPWKLAAGVEGERRVDGRKASDEVVFKSAYLSFRGVLAMDGWGCKLEGDGVIGDVILEGGGGLVIEFLEFRF